MKRARQKRSYILDSIYVKYPDEANPQTEGRLEVARGGEADDGVRLLSGYGASFQGDEAASELDRGDGSTTLRMHQMPLNRSL